MGLAGMAGQAMAGRIGPGRIPGRTGRRKKWRK